MEVLICVLPSEGPFCKITEKQPAKEFSCSQHLSRKAKVDRLSMLLLCENITTAIQVKRHHVVVMSGKDFWLICGACICMNRGTGDFDDYGANTHS
jgi:hypothetical protein